MNQSGVVRLGPNDEQTPLSHQQQNITVPVTSPHANSCPNLPQLDLLEGLYHFSDFPWPEEVTDVYPTRQQMLYYLHSYANKFDLMQHIKLNSKVKGISYDGPSSEAWKLWNGTGETFSPDGKWNVSVEDTRNATTQVYTVDFVILCLGRFKDVPNIPEFPQGKGPEVFQGKVIHSMEYATMDHDNAAEFVKGKKVVVFGFGS